MVDIAYDSQSMVDRICIFSSQLYIVRSARVLDLFDACSYDLVMVSMDYLAVCASIWLSFSG